MPPKRKRATVAPAVETNPDENPSILDGKAALRASPDAEGKGEAMEVAKVIGEENAGMLDMDKELEIKEEKTPKRTRVSVKKEVKEEPDSELSEVDADVASKDFAQPTDEPSDAKKAKKTPTKASRAAKKGADEIKAFIAEQAALKKANGTPESKKPRGKASKVKKEEDVDAADLNRDPEAESDGGEKEDVDVEKKEAARPPPVNSDYLPLPWKGRLGYVSPLPLPANTI
jgi:UV DNA damage endonuclease